jgi:hypothetical protein
MNFHHTSKDFSSGAETSDLASLQRQWLAIDLEYQSASDAADDLEERGPEAPAALFVRDGDAPYLTRRAVLRFDGRQWYGDPTIWPPSGPQTRDRVSEILGAWRQWQDDRQRYRESSGLRLAEEHRKSIGERRSAIMDRIEAAFPGVEIR